MWSVPTAHWRLPEFKVRDDADSILASVGMPDLGRFADALNSWRGGFVQLTAAQTETVELIGSGGVRPARYIMAALLGGPGNQNRASLRRATLQLETGSQVWGTYAYLTAPANETAVFFIGNQADLTNVPGLAAAQQFVGARLVETGGFDTDAFILLAGDLP